MLSDLSDIFREGGMSAPAWAFFTTILAALIALLRESIQARHAANDAKKAAGRASDQIDEVRKLSEPTGNGFAEKVLRGQEDIVMRLKRLETGQDAQASTLMAHLLEHDRKHDHPID